MYFSRECGKWNTHGKITLKEVTPREGRLTTLLSLVLIFEAHGGKLCVNVNYKPQYS